MRINKKTIFWVIFILIIIGGFIFFYNTTSTDIKCGNGICDYRETITCPQDCPSGNEPFCGDNICEIGEVCQADCGIQPPKIYCGDDICQYSESKKTCPKDCGWDLPVCGDGKCVHFRAEGIEVDEWKECPSDCGIICGNGWCESVDVYNEREHCPQDCDMLIRCGDGFCQDGESPMSCPSDCSEVDNDNLIYNLNQKQRPLVGGLSIEMPRGDHYALCTLGTIVRMGGTKYILTAGHCVTDGEDGFPDPDDIGLKIKQGEEVIGSVYKTDFTGGVDVALISINQGISSELETFLGDDVLEFGTVYKGLKVFKIGRTTGLTYGTVTDWVGYTGSDGKQWKGFEVTGDNGKFSKSGDSGSAIITVSKPHKIVGIISAGSGSNMPEDIKNKLNID